MSAPKSQPAAPRAAGTSREPSAAAKAELYQGKGLPVASEDYTFPAMQLVFGEATLKEGLVPQWEPSLELDNWGNPLPNASEATRR